MSLTRLLTATAFAALLAGPALAQTIADPEPMPLPVIPQTTVDHATGVTTTTTSISPAPSAESAAMPASTLAPDQAPGTLTTSVTTNGPVADTPENRRRYGSPMSRAGKSTAPIGN